MTFGTNNQNYSRIFCTGMKLFLLSRVNNIFCVFFKFYISYLNSYSGTKFLFVLFCLFNKSREILFLFLFF